LDDFIVSHRRLVDNTGLGRRWLFLLHGSQMRNIPIFIPTSGQEEQALTKWSCGAGTNSTSEHDSVILVV
jgi:hypothetical protein